MISNFDKKQKRVIFKRNFYFIVAGILFLVASILLIFADIKIYKEKQKLNAQLEGYKKQIQEIEDRNKALKEGIAEANNNNYIEKVAREELDLQKQGENVVTFIMPPQQLKEKKVNSNFWTGWISGIFEWIRNKF